MIRVRYIDVVPWKRWRHRRLRAIWQTLAEMTTSAWTHAGSRDQKVEIVPFLNEGKLSHADCLEHIWREEVEQADYLIITESDFLPAPNWLMLTLDGLGEEMTLAPEAPCLAPLKQRDNAGDTEVWYICFKLKHPDLPRELRWQHERDPGADLHEQIPGLKHYTGKLEPEKHPGWAYPYGVHLLGQRHLHDPVDMPLWGGMMAGDLQRLHDSYVESWLSEQSPEFQEVYQEHLRRLEST